MSKIIYLQGKGVMSTYWLTGCDHSGPLASSSLKQYEEAHSIERMTSQLKVMAKSNTLDLLSLTSLDHVDELDI